jgi:hypothetical protein
MAPQPVVTGEHTRRGRSSSQTSDGSEPDWNAVFCLVPGAAEGTASSHGIGRTQGGPAVGHAPLVLACEADEVHLSGGRRTHATHRRSATGLTVRLGATDLYPGFGWGLFAELREPQQAHCGSTISIRRRAVQEGQRPFIPASRDEAS